ncbi:unnamed protein product [Closterium sp. NIES-54]
MMTGSCTVRSSGNWVELPRWQSPESSTVHINAITMKRVVATGADVYAVDIVVVKETEQPSDFQNLLAARQFRLTQPELDEPRKQLDYLLEKKIIRPSLTPFAAPILFTPKKDGGFCMCIDYRALNKVTVKSGYPIPRADELIDQLRTARVFSKIGLRGGYHQIRVEPLDCAKTAFRTRCGSFEYTVMPFELTNAPATFQMTMNEAFRPLLDKCMIIYLDNILVYSRDKQQHLADLEAVLTVFDKHRLLTKGSKCEFFQDRLEFLGHVISGAGVEIDPKKLDMVKAWHPSMNITELQSFLGFTAEGGRFYVGGERACCLLCPEKCSLFTACTAHRRPTPPIRGGYRCKRHRHWSRTATGFRQRVTAHRIRVTKTASAREKLPNTRSRNARDC